MAYKSAYEGTKVLASMEKARMTHADSQSTNFQIHITLLSRGSSLPYS